MLISVLLSVVLVENLTELLVKTEIFRPIRKILSQRSEFFKKLLSCGQCSSFWLSLAVVFLTQTTYPLTEIRLLDLGLMALVVHRVSNYLHNFNDKCLDKYYSNLHTNSHREDN